MTGSYDLYRAAMRQSGLIEVDDVEPIVDIAKLFAPGPPAARQGRRRAVDLGRLRHRVRRSRRARRADPAEILGCDARRPAQGDPRRSARSTTRPTSPPACSTTCRLFTTTLDIVLADPGIDQLSILLASIGGAPAQRAAEAIAAAAAKTDKPVHVAWSGRRAKSVAAAEILEAARIPVLTTPVRLAQAAAVLARFADDRRRLLPRKAPPLAMPSGLVLPDGAVTLNEAESKAVLRAFGIPVASESAGCRCTGRGFGTSRALTGRSPSKSFRATSPTRPRPVACNCP